jgi:hypothetical protein
MPLRRPEASHRPPARLRRLGGALRALKIRRGPRQAASADRWKASDFAVAGLGLALGFGCAVFPWYIFFNQEKFGVRAVRFEGNPNQLRSAGMRLDDQRIDIEMEQGLILPEQLDLFATGTVRDQEEEKADIRAAPAVQPFPDKPIEFRMIHATPGRAMIADDTGIWVVQRGSLLPDNSLVASIEQRAGTWVLVTSDERVVEISPD